MSKRNRLIKGTGIKYPTSLRLKFDWKATPIACPDCVTGPPLFPGFIAESV